MYKIIAQIILLLFSLSISADTLTNKKKNKENQTVSIISNDKTAITESEAYKLLYENSKENNEKIVSTIQWVIGLSAGFLLTILGTQIFFNWRINKKEIDYIKKDIEEKIGELKAELIKDLGQTIKEQDIKINTTIQKLEKNVLDKVTQEFTNNKQLTELSEKLNDVKITGIKTALTNEVKKLKIDIEKMGGDIWKIKGVEANALSSYLRTAQLQIELGREVKYILDDIISILNGLTEIHEYDNQKLDQITSELSPAYNSQKEKIISLYIDKPVYTYQPSQNFDFGFSLGSPFVSNKKYVKNQPK